MFGNDTVQDHLLVRRLAPSGMLKTGYVVSLLCCRFLARTHMAVAWGRWGNDNVWDPFNGDHSRDFKMNWSGSARVSE
jgi:hypothetical protein